MAKPSEKMWDYCIATAQWESILWWNFLGSVNFTLHSFHVNADALLNASSYVLHALTIGVKDSTSILPNSKLWTDSTMRKFYNSTFLNDYFKWRYDSLTDFWWIDIAMLEEDVEQLMRVERYLWFWIFIIISRLLFRVKGFRMAPCRPI